MEWDVISTDYQWECSVTKHIRLRITETNEGETWHYEILVVDNPHWHWVCSGVSEVSLEDAKEKVFELYRGESLAKWHARKLEQVRGTLSVLEEIGSYLSREAKHGTNLDREDSR